MTRQSIRLRKLCALTAIISLMGLPACYTLFSHPRLASLNYQRPDEARCLKCHSSVDLWRYVHPTGLPDDNAEWASYYSDPWWFDERHYEKADSARVGKKPAGSSRKKEARK